MPNGKSLMTPTKKSPNLTTVTATPSRAWGREGEPPSGLRTFYVASICRGGATLGEMIIVMSDHFLQNSTDHFAVTQKRKSCIAMAASQVRFGRNPNPQWKKEGAKFSSCHSKTREVPAGVPAPG